MSYEYNPANLGNPLFRQASHAEQCPGVIQKPPGSQPPSQELPPSGAGLPLLTLPSSTLPQSQIQLPTSTSSEGGILPHSRIRGEEFEFGGVLRSSSASSLTPKFEFGGVLPSSSSTTPNVSEYGGELSTSSSGGILPSSSMSSIATPNVASGDLLRQLVLDRPKLPLSRLMQVSSKFKGNLTHFSAKEIPPNVVISAEHALVATIPASSTKPNSPPTSGRAGSSSPEPETVPVEPQKSEPTSPMEWNPDTLLASSSTATDETKQKPIVTITQSSSEEIRMLAPNITIEYRGPVPTFSTPLQPPV